MKENSKTEVLRLRPDLGAAMRKERTAQGLNLSALAEKAGLNWGHLSQIESGTIRAEKVSLLIWDRLCFGLGKDLNWLMKGNTVAPAKPRPSGMGR